MSSQVNAKDHAPRDIAGLMQLHQTQRWIFAYRMGLFAPGDDDQTAFLLSAPEQQCQRLLAEILDRDKNGWGVDNVILPVTPPMPTVEEAPAQSQIYEMPSMTQPPTFKQIMPNGQQPWQQQQQQQPPQQMQQAPQGPQFAMQQGMPQMPPQMQYQQQQQQPQMQYQQPPQMQPMQMPQYMPPAMPTYQTQVQPQAKMPAQFPQQAYMPEEPAFPVQQAYTPQAPPQEVLHSISAVNKSVQEQLAEIQQQLVGLSGLTVRVLAAVIAAANVGKLNSGDLATMVQSLCTEENMKSFIIASSPGK